MAAAIAVAASHAPAQNRALSPSDFMHLKQVSHAELAPDGRQVLFVVKTPHESPAEKDTHIWISATQAGAVARPFLLSAGEDFAPRWSPDGESIAFLSDRANPITSDPGSNFSIKLEGAGNEAVREAGAKNDDPQLWLIPAHGGEAIPLTNLTGGIKSFAWSPDGQSIAFVRRDQPTQEELEQKKKKYDQIEVDRNYKYDRLWIYEVATRTARRLATIEENIDSFNWSPDGTQFVARVSPTPRMDDYWRVSRVALYNARTGKRERVLEENSGYMEPVWSCDGTHVAFSRMTGHHIADEHVILDLKTGHGVRLEDSFAGTIMGANWSRDGRELLGQGVLGVRPLLLGADAVTGKVREIADAGLPSAYEADPQTSADNTTMAYLAQTLTHPAEVWIKPAGKPAFALTHFNAEVDRWPAPTQRPLQWTNAKDGRTIHGVLVLPADADAAKPLKMMVHVHGGPEEAWTLGWHGEWYDYAFLLASHGYAVFLPNPRGSDGQGPAFAAENYQDWGGGDFEDVQSGVDALVKSGVADAQRLVVGGWSYGGFMTSWTVTHTDRYKAAMVGAGVTDLVSMATTTDIAPSFEDGYFGPMRENLALYDARSPVRSLTHCHTPVLVLHGEADPRVPISQGEEFYYGLRFLGREARMVRYPREPHVFSEMPHQIDSLTRLLDWYDVHTK